MKLPKTICTKLKHSPTESRQDQSQMKIRCSIPCDTYLIQLGQSALDVVLMKRNSYRLQKATLCTAHQGTNSRIYPEEEMAKVHVYYFRSNFNSSVWIHSRQVSAGASKNRNILVNSLVELLYMLNSPDNITSDEHLSNALHKQHQGTVLQHWIQPLLWGWPAY